jgi:hypothetical protein
VREEIFGTGKRKDQQRTHMRARHVEVQQCFKGTSTLPIKECMRIIEEILPVPSYTPVLRLQLLSRQHLAHAASRDNL